MDVMSESSSSASLLAVAVGAPIVVAAVLGSAVGVLDPSASALLLVLVIVVVTLRGDWLADLLAVLASAAGFDFFLTAPFHSLKIHSSADIEVTAAMLLVGAATGALSMWARSRDAVASRRGDWLAEVSRAGAAGSRGDGRGAGGAGSCAEVASQVAQVLGADDGRWVEGAAPAGDAVVQAPDRMMVEGAGVDPTLVGLPTDRFISFPAGPGHVRVSAASWAVLPSADQMRAACALAARLADSGAGPAGSGPMHVTGR